MNRVLGALLLSRLVDVACVDCIFSILSGPEESRMSRRLSKQQASVSANIPGENQHLTSNHHRAPQFHVQGSSPTTALSTRW